MQILSENKVQARICGQCILKRLHQERPQKREILLVAYDTVNRQQHTSFVTKCFPSAIDVLSGKKLVFSCVSL